MATENEKKTRKKESLGARIRHGRWLSTDFFSKNKVVVGAITIMFLVYINSRYQCLTRMETIQKLNKELSITKAEFVYQKSKYMSSTREAAMRELVDSMRLNLTVQEQPPFKIKY